MRGAPGSADHAETVNSKVISDSLNVTSGICDRTVTVPVRARITGPVITDQADAKPIEHNPTRPRAFTATRRAVEQEHWLSIRGA